MSEVSMESLQTRVVALEMAVMALQKVAKSGGGQASEPAQEFRPFTDEQLAMPWADKTVRKDPRFWKGASYEGQTYGECAPEFLECLAEQLEWSANRDRDNPEAKKDAKGKPYYERDLFDARLCRSWAAKHRRAANAATAPQVEGELPF